MIEVTTKQYEVIKLMETGFTTAGDIARELGITKATVVSRVNPLVDDGLVVKERHKGVNYYFSTLKKVKINDKLRRKRPERSKDAVIEYKILDAFLGLPA